MDTLHTTLDHVFTGRIRTLPPDDDLTGIFKTPVAGPVRVTRLGLEGDQQADRINHGGPDKAVHHYAADHYHALAQAFPASAADFVPGSLGENLSSCGLTEHQLCIGDVLRVGSALLQVSQPRSPCWKINHKFEQPRLSRYVADQAITGWYYRVLEEGEVWAGAEVALQERSRDAIGVATLWRIHTEHRPDAASLARAATAPHLNEAWKKKLAERADWLRRNT